MTSGLERAPILPDSAQASSSAPGAKTPVYVSGDTLDNSARTLCFALVNIRFHTCIQGSKLRVPAQSPTLEQVVQPWARGKGVQAGSKPAKV